MASYAVNMTMRSPCAFMSLRSGARTFRSRSVMRPFSNLFVRDCGECQTCLTAACLFLTILSVRPLHVFLIHYDHADGQAME